MASPALAVAAVTADAVALGASAGCNNGQLRVTLTNNGADWESWLATSLAGSELTRGAQFTSFPQSGQATRTFPQVFSPSQPDGTLIGSYAYVGEASPDAGNTAEFFIFYKCSTLAGPEVLLTCLGPFGTCPQTAQEAMARLAAVPRIPAVGPLTLALMATLLAGAGGLALARRA